MLRSVQASCGCCAELRVRGATEELLAGHDSCRQPITGLRDAACPAGPTPLSHLREDRAEPGRGAGVVLLSLNPWGAS